MVKRTNPFKVALDRFSVSIGFLRLKKLRRKGGAEFAGMKQFNKATEVQNAEHILNCIAKF